MNFKLVIRIPYYLSVFVIMLLTLTTLPLLYHADGGEVVTVHVSAVLLYSLMCSIFFEYTLSLLEVEAVIS